MSMSDISDSQLAPIRDVTRTTYKRTLHIIVRESDAESRGSSHNVIEKSTTQPGQTIPIISIISSDSPFILSTSFCKRYIPYLDKTSGAVNPLAPFCL